LLIEKAVKNSIMKKSFFLFIIFCSFLSHAQIKETSIVKELKKLSDISRLPHYERGTKSAMLSSYDTTGSNDDGFSGKYSYIRKEAGERLVMADLKGPGVINRIWTPTPSDDTIEFYFDAEKIPRIRLKFNELFSGSVFPFLSPLAGHGVGGYYSYIPIPYAKSCKIIYIGKELKFHQVQYKSYLKGEDIQTFTINWGKEENEAFRNAANLWNLYGKNILNINKDKTAQIQILKTDIVIKPGEIIPIASINKGGRIAGIEINNAFLLEGQQKDLILKAKWDDENTFAINAPAADFFGYAFGKRATHSLLLGSRADTNYCYLPMPFDNKAQFQLSYLKRSGQIQPDLQMSVKLYYTNKKRDSNNEGKFYAVWRRTSPDSGKPYTFIKQQGRGHEAGTILLSQGTEEGNVYFPTGFFEGDDITTIDGEMRMHGTGSEDYFNGGWYAVPDRWDEAFSLPLHGCLDYSLPMARTGGYRFKLSDKVSFEKDYELTIEHGPEGNKWKADYSSLCFYYGDTPPQNYIEPTTALTKVISPEKMEVYVNFLNMKAFGFISFPSSLDYDTIQGREVFILEGKNAETSIKTDLNITNDGTYDLYVSYFKSPGSNQLRLFQRNNPITGWINTHANKVSFVDKEYMGKFKVVNGKSPLTFATKGEKGKCAFILQRIFLVKNKSQEQF